MSIRYTFVELKMLYRTKEKFLKNSYSIVECDSKEKSGARLITSTVVRKSLRIEYGILKCLKRISRTL